MKKTILLIIISLLVFAAESVHQESHSEPPRALQRGGRQIVVNSSQRVRRQVVVKRIRFGNGNATNYRLPLEHDELFATEIDGNQGFSVGRFGIGSIDVRKNERGRASSYTVALGKIRYYDLNGDGYIDAMYDRTKSRSKIILDGRFVDVRNSKSGFHRSFPVKSLDGRTVYVFEGNAWKLGQVRRPFGK